jgi:hypothetical protein
MTALSTQFINNMDDLPVGTLPETIKNVTLSRKVQSELNLAAMQKTRPSWSFTSSVASGFWGESGDPLPDEMTILEHTGMEPASECEALVALRVLGTLVARRRGLDANGFIHGLVVLLSQTRPAETLAGCIEEEDKRPSRQGIRSDAGIQQYFDQGLAALHTLRRFQSQPQLSTPQKHRRQFSFEPGADQLEVLSEELGALDGETNESDSDDSDTALLMHARRPALDTQSIKSTSSSQTLGADLGKPSKIPSPVQTSGRSRREASVSSIQSISVMPQDSRRGSRSSVVTAFRGNSSDNIRPELQSRNNSMNKLHTSDSPPRSRDQPGGTRLCDNAMSIAAARAASGASQTSSSESESPRLSLSRANNSEGSVKLGNDGHKRTSSI